MDYLTVCTVALLVSGLSLFSGFGLGTLLMPAFALFFPVHVAIAATAVVHLANNLFKLVLMGRHARASVVLRFGVPAALAAVLGAAALVGAAGLQPLTEYRLFGTVYSVTPLKLAIGVLISVFASLELTGALERVAIPQRLLPLGGLLSGFFGGLSGNQGAFRSAFLIKAGLDKHAFVATGVVVAVMVDTVRLTIYGASYFGARLQVASDDALPLVAAASLAAFLGAFAGSRLLDKVTLRAVQLIVALGMFVVGFGLAAGLI